MAAKKSSGRVMDSIYLRPEVLDELRRLAEQLDVPRAQLLREAVDDLLKKYAKELRRAKK